MDEDDQKSSGFNKSWLLLVIIILALPMSFYYIQPKNNIPSIINFSSNLLSPQSAGTNISFAVKSYDRDNDTIYCRFLLNDRVEQDWSEQSTWLWNTKGLLTGNYSIQVQVKDMKHSKDYSNFDSCKFILFRIDNQPPKILNFHSDHISPASSGTYVAWIAESSDNNGDNLYYRFLVDGNVERNWSMYNTWLWDTTNLETKKYFVHVQVRDLKHDDCDDESGILFKIEKPYGAKELLVDAIDVASMATGIGDLYKLGKRSIRYLADDAY